MTQFKATRIATDGQSIISSWTDEAGTELCVCVEPGLLRPTHPGIKVGEYPLRLRTVGKKHADYLKWYGPVFHQGMIEICDVPGREAIEFHVGNTFFDTLGCSCCGEKAIHPGEATSKHWEVTRSRVTYERVYPILRDAILAGATSLLLANAKTGAGV